MIDFLFVNHSRHEIGYMRAQVRTFEICNPSGGYRLIVANGTGDEGHTAQLEDLGYTVVTYDRTPIDLDWEWDDSAQHGEGLQIALGLVETDIFCAQDPDHFWVGKDFCARARDLMGKYAAVSMGSNLDAGRDFDVIKHKIEHELIHETEGKLRRPSGLVSLMGGTFLHTAMMREHRLTFEHSRRLYRMSNWDEGFLIVNHLEKHHADNVFWLQPQRVEMDDRYLSFATEAYLDGKVFAVHVKGGSIAPEGGFGFADKTKQLRPRLIAYAKNMARKNCR